VILRRLQILGCQWHARIGHLRERESRGDEREGKGREGKGREGKGREGKGREGKGREEGGGVVSECTHTQGQEEPARRASKRGRRTAFDEEFANDHFPS
jgi:hypothetical protein